MRALRGVRITKKKEAEKKAVDEKKEEKPRENIGASLFGAKPSVGGGAANPFSTASGAGGNPFANPFSTGSASNNPFAAPNLPTNSLAALSPQQPISPPTSSSTDLPKTFASALNITSLPPATFGPQPPPEPWPSDLPKAYPQYYLEDDMEYLDKLPLPDQAIITETMDLDEPNGSSSGGGGKEDKEVYESTIDKAFQKFADRLSQNPEQVIRYEFKGQPLLYSKTDAAAKAFSGSGEGKVKTTAGGIPKCGSCGSERVFEVQLTPHTIMELEKEEEGLDGMEWGTVILGVCGADCGKVGEVSYSEEWAGVQWEELRR